MENWTDLRNFPLWQSRQYVYLIKADIFIWPNSRQYWYLCASLVAQLIKNPLQCRRPGFNPWIETIPWRRDKWPAPVFLSFPFGSDGKESTCSVGGLGLIPGFERSPGGGHGNSLQYSCLENLKDRGAWWATVHGPQRVGHNWVTKHLGTFMGFCITPSSCFSLEKWSSFKVHGHRTLINLH